MEGTRAGKGGCVRSTGAISVLSRDPVKLPASTAAVKASPFCGLQSQATASVNPTMQSWMLTTSAVDSSGQVVLML